MGTKKHKQPKGETRHGTAACFERAREDTRHAINKVVDRLEHNATKQLRQIITTTLEDATSVTAAMHQALAESQSASSKTLDEMEAGRRQIRERLAALYGRMEEQASAVEADAERLRAHARTAVESILTDAEEQRVALAHACDVTAAAAHEVTTRGREQLEETDRQGRELAARFEDVIARVRGQAEAQIAELVHEIEQQATERERAREHAQELDRLARVRIEQIPQPDDQTNAPPHHAAERASEFVTQTQAYGEALDAEQLTRADLAPAPVPIPVPSRSRSEPEIRHDSLEDELEREAPFEEGFFDRLAAELRADQDSDRFPTGDDDELATVGASSAQLSAPRPASVATQDIARDEPTDVESRPEQRAPVQTVGTGPVNIGASLAAISACVQQLARGATGSRVRIEVSRTAAAGTTTLWRLRLTTYDPAGWWTYGDIPVSADTELSAATVVDLEELHEAVGLIDRFVGGSETSILLDGNVAIGNHLLLAQDSDGLPPLSSNHVRIEPVDLQAANRPGLVIETQLGRLLVPPNLLAYLRRQQAADTELIAVDGMPCLSAHFTGSAADPRLTIVAPLQELGEHDNPIIDERRTQPGNEVTQLVGALSTSSTPEELERILKVGVGYVRRRAAANRALPQEHILDLIRRGTAAMRAAAASNVSITTEGADLATADPSSAVRAAVAANPSIPEGNLEQLASDPIAQVRARVASNPTASCELLERLADDPDASVRAAVACQGNVSIDTLLVLARDPETMVCAAVATNPSCPPDVLNELVSIVPDSVLANPSASPALLVAGSVIDASRLRATVAANPATPAKRLRKLARDTDPDVLRAIAAHPGAPPSARRRAQRALPTN